MVFVDVSLAVPRGEAEYVLEDVAEGVAHDAVEDGEAGGEGEERSDGEVVTVGRGGEPVGGREEVPVRLPAPLADAVPVPLPVRLPEGVRPAEPEAVPEPAAQGPSVQPQYVSLLGYSGTGAPCSGPSSCSSSHRRVETPAPDAPPRKGMASPASSPAVSRGCVEPASQPAVRQSLVHAAAVPY
jgi:hypothetical protein